MPATRFAATQAVIWNLAKVMLIKDEPYVSYLLTRYEKKQRDIAKYDVDVSNGDRLSTAITPAPNSTSATPHSPENHDDATGN